MLFTTIISVSALLDQSVCGVLIFKLGLAPVEDTFGLKKKFK